jgi:hypothetical protein
MLNPRRCVAQALSALIDTAPGHDRVVSTESGVVTLIDLNDLKSRVEGRRAEVNGKLEQAKSLRALADDRYAELGHVLVTNPTKWNPPPNFALMVDQARSLQGRVDTDSEAITTNSQKERHGLSGLVGRVGDWSQTHKAEADRARLEPQLRALLIQIAQSAPPVDFDPATNVRSQAQVAVDQAVTLETQAKSASAELGIMEEELKRRDSAQQQMGFDAPYLAAYLATYGPAAVDGPLKLKRGERALAVVPARLARQQARTQYVGGSRGVSFPIGHTGIRYRVGSFHGHPVQTQVMTTLDSGNLEITNQRIAFIGSVKSTSVALEKILHVECYSDALALFREGRENPDFFLTDRPQYALFMLNWATAQA